MINIKIRLYFFLIISISLIPEYSVANQCRSVSIESLVNGSDAIVMAYPIEMRMTQADFEEFFEMRNSQGKRFGSKEIGQGWNDYLKNTPYAKMKSLVVYSGNLPENEYFDVANGPVWKYNYRIGGKYILFLTELSSNKFDVETCIHVDLDSYSVVKDNTVSGDITITSILEEIRERKRSDKIEATH